jgi:hypothetical protein
MKVPKPGPLSTRVRTLERRIACEITFPRLLGYRYELGVETLMIAGRLGVAGDTLRFVRFIKDFPVFPSTNSWDDTSVAGCGDTKIYIVQTNTKGIERCLLMSADPGDLVLDPICGSGTTANLAEQWGRRSITASADRVGTSSRRASMRWCSARSAGIGVGNADRSRP